MSGRESNERKKKKKKLSSLRSLLSNTNLSLKPPYHFECWSSVTLNYMHVRECVWVYRCPPRPEVLGPPGDGGTDSCEPPDMGSEYLELGSSAGAVSTGHLSSPTSLFWKAKVLLRFLCLLEPGDQHLSSVHNQYFFLWVFFYSKFAVFSCCSTLRITLPCSEAPSNASM